MKLVKDVFPVENGKVENTNNLQPRVRLGTGKSPVSWIAQLMEGFLPRIVQSFPVSFAEVYIKQEKKPELVRTFSYPLSSKEIFKNEKYQLGEGLLGNAAQQVNPSIHDVHLGKQDEINPTLKELEIQSVICFPMRSEGGVMGVMCLASKQKQPFNNRQTGLLTGLANWAGMLLYYEQQTLEIQRRIVIDERERIGMDLHDGIIQSLYAVGLILQNTHLLLTKDVRESEKQIEIAMDALNEAIRDIRAYILDLRPRQLRDEDLLTGMQSLAREFRANTFVDVELDGKPQDVEQLNDEATEALFHIFQESLANIAKHAKAEKVQVRLWRTQDRMMLKVNDDGKGFDLNKVNQRIGHGLSNMHTRAESVSGGIEIISIRRQGTTILAWVPLK